jgi:hypothetical protein
MIRIGSQRHRRRRRKKTLTKTMASPVFACLHTKQIMVVISIEEKGEAGNYISNFKQISSIACFTAMAVSETRGRALKASLRDYLSKQGSHTKYDEIETYVDKWDIENMKRGSELSKVEMKRGSELIKVEMNQ